MSSAVILIILGVVFFLILILIAVRLGISDTEKEQKPEDIQPVIHTSGIYSIVRKSPSENIDTVKPSIDKVRQYLSDQNVDIEGKELSETDKEALLDLWKASLEKSIKTVEEGDKRGIEFYYYKISKDKNYSPIPKGAYVTREEIFKNPNLLPPFYIGCTIEILPHEGEGSTDLNDTTTIGMHPLVNKGIMPDLPDWKDIRL